MYKKQWLKKMWEKTNIKHIFVFIHGVIFKVVFTSHYDNVGSNLDLEMEVLWNFN